MSSERHRLPVDYGLMQAVRIYALRLATVAVVVALNVLTLLLLYWIQGSPSIPSQYQWLSSAGVFIILFILLVLVLRNQIASIVRSLLNAELRQALYEKDEEDYDKSASGTGSIEAGARVDTSIKKGNGRGFTSELTFRALEVTPGSRRIPDEPAEFSGRNNPFDQITGAAAISPIAITEHTPVTTFHTDQGWGVKVEWSIGGTTAPDLAGEWEVRVYAESLDSGEDKQIGDTILVPLNSVPPLPLPRRYATTVSVPRFSADPTRGLPVGRYRLVTVITHKDPSMPYAAFVDGPTFEIYE